MPAQLIRVRPGGGAEKTNLPAITPAPFAEPEMNAQASALDRRKRLVEGVRLQTDGFPATGQQGADSLGNPVHLSRLVGAGFKSLQIIYNFPNQLVSRQRRNAIRARCSITHKLLSEMFNAAQISRLARPSISRSMNTAATFFGSLSEQS